MAQRAPQQTPKHEREQQWVRVAVIGAGKVGKTNLITRLAQDEYAGARASKSPLPPIKFEGPLTNQDRSDHACSSCHQRLTRCPFNTHEPAVSVS